MLSRVANSLFWLGRYLERAENTARFLGVTYAYAQELRGISHAAADQCWTVARQLIEQEETPPEEEREPLRGMAALRRLALDPELPDSVLTTVLRARENARGIRDAIQSEMWEELNVLFMLLQEEAAAAPSETGTLAILQRVRNVSHLFQGIRDNTMIRADEYHFLCLGQYLERAGMTTRVLDAMCLHPAPATALRAGQRIDLLHLSAMLRCCTAYETYCRSWHTVTLAQAAGFLLLDHRFPRSVERCVLQIESGLRSLSGTPSEEFSNEAQQIAGRLAAELRFAKIEEIVEQGLHNYLVALQSRLGTLGQAIHLEFFR